MPNHNQLEALTSTQASLIDAALSAGSLKVSELVKIHWPSPDGAKVYSWWNCLADSAYTTPLTAWLAGDPLVPGFIAQDEHKAERFHTITRTADLSDDVVSMRVVNYGRTFEGLCYQHRGGVKVEFFYFFPEIADDAAGTAYSVINWFTGHLRKADSANEDFVNVSVRKGIRSPQVLVPSRVPASNCQWYYNGDTDADGNRVFPTGLADNPCDIDKHYGGSKGTNDPATGQLWARCNHTLDQGTNNCTAINGSLALAREIYGGDDYVVESTLIGRGDHKTRSTTIGNEIRLENLPVLYGEWHIKQLQLARHAKEYNPSEDNQDQGTIRTVFKVSEGPIEEITAVKVMDRDLPRTDGLGLEVRLGTQRQTATTYSTDMLSLNRTAHIRGDVNPVDPTGVQAQDILGECKGKGRNTVNIYAADGTYTQAYTYNRADCFADLLLNQWYGYRMDKARLSLDDVVYLRALSSNFHAYVQQRTVQQLMEDICLAAVGGGSPGWFRPLWYNGKLRILPILDTDLTLSDIPQIKSNFGSTRNVIIDPATKLARMEPFYRDYDEIPTAYTVTINDAQHGSIERPITFNADLDQYKEGTLYGDTSKRRDPRTVAGMGLTTEAEARVLGEYLVKMGPFATGGLLNNCSVTFTICAVSSIGLNLHENKIVKLPTASNDRLEKYTDADGDQFQYFLVTGMRRTSRLELEVTAQAWVSLSTALCVCTPKEKGSLELDGGLEAVFIEEDWTVWPKTFSVWLKLLAYPASDGTVMALESGADFRLGVDSTGHLFFSSSATVTATSTLSLNTWYHVALTAAAGDPASRKVYVNGVEVISTTGNDNSVGTPSSVQFYLGNDNGSLNGLQCRLTAFHAWNAVLSAAEVLADYNANCYEIDVVTGSIRYWFPYHRYSDGALDGSGNGVLSSQSGTYTTDYPTNLEWCQDACAGATSETSSTSGYVTWPTGDTDAIDGPFGVRTQILSVSADRGASSYAIPTTIDTADVTLARWTHTITALPTSGYSYNVWHETSALGFKVWHDGSGWIYYGGAGTDTSTFPASSLSVGDTLEVEYNFNSGSPVRYYRHNGTTVRTDSTGTINPVAEIAAVCLTTGDYIGPISYYVEYSGCVADYAVQPVGQSGGSVVIDTPGSGSSTDSGFDVLAWQVLNRPEPYLQAEAYD